ncbi:MAG: hypothetical protein ACXW3S_17165 [Rhodoplanes sp.]
MAVAAAEHVAQPQDQEGRHERKQDDVDKLEFAAHHNPFLSPPMRSEATNAF